MSKVVAFVLLATVFLPNVCYAGLGDPVPAGDEDTSITLNGQVVVVPTLAGGDDDYEDPQGAIFSIMAVVLVIGYLIALALGVRPWPFLTTRSRKNTEARPQTPTGP